MQSIAAVDIRRRGLAALERLLERGPVQVLRKNRPAWVVLSTAEYERLAARVELPEAAAADVWALLDAGAATGLAKRTRAEIDAALSGERDGWHGG